MILVDNAYFGKFIKSARKNARLKSFDAAKMLRITSRKLAKYESGKELIPDFVIEKLLYNGWTMLAARNIKHK